MAMHSSPKKALKFFPWSKLDGTTEIERPKTIHIFIGYFFIVDYCIGAGFLGFPYSFFYSGYLAALPTFLVVALVNYITLNYLLETMARAQALEYLKEFQERFDIDDSDSEQDQILNMSSLVDHPRFWPPRFEIRVERKFEITELCELFVNKYFKYLYLFLYGLFTFLMNWSFTTVAGTAWATTFFHRLGNVEACQHESFFHRALPEGGCLYAYYICLTVFAAIVVPLSVLELKEQAFVQVTLGFLRFVTVAMIVVYCIVRLAMGGDACSENLHNMTNLTIPINVVDIKSIVLKFDPRGWVVAIPVFTFAFVFHTGVSSLIHPIKQKEYLHWLIMVIVISTSLCYLSLGVVVPLWFRASIQEVSSLNWVTFTHSSAPLPLKILSYTITLLPSLDVISAFPLINHAWVNNIYILITGRDTSLKATHRFDWIFRIFLRAIFAMLPILAAAGVANLIYVLKYAGLVAFISLIFPTLLQIRSIHVCKKKFSEFHSSESDSHSKETSQDSKADNPKEQALYMTPYSNKVFSHPVFVWVITGIGGCLILLTVVGLFVHPEKMSCSVPEDMI